MAGWTANVQLVDLAEFRDVRVEGELEERGGMERI